MFFQSHMLQKGQMGHWPLPASVNATDKHWRWDSTHAESQAAFISTAK